MKTCSSGKRSYHSEGLAEDALIDVWSRVEFKSGSGPVGIYLCDECGNFHFTSVGTMNARLAQYIKDGKLKVSREAERWARKFR